VEGRLRLREPQITPIEGGFLVSDPYGVYEKPLALTEGGLFLLSLMEGRTLEEVQEEVFKRHGVLVPKKELEDLAKALEEAGLLLTEKVEARLKEEEEKLKRERPMRLAGLSYPEGEREARAFLEAFRASYPGEGEEARVLLMPHLEPSRVPEVYGAALAALEKTPPPERIYLVGVAHRPLKEKAAALPVPFQTPFGPALPDLPALQALDALLPFELFNTPLAFREEHSLELPLFFLKGRFPEARVLPLLVARRSPELGEALRAPEELRPLLERAKALPPEHAVRALANFFGLHPDHALLHHHPHLGAYRNLQLPLGALDLDPPGSHLHAHALGYGNG